MKKKKTSKYTLIKHYKKNKKNKFYIFYNILIEFKNFILSKKQ